MEILLNLVLVLGLLFLGQYLLQKHTRLNSDDFNLLYAGYFSIKGIMKLSEIITISLMGAASLQLLAGALLMLIVDSAFAYFFFKRSGAL
jgi:hypothetical protein